MFGRSSVVFGYCGGESWEDFCPVTDYAVAGMGEDVGFAVFVDGDDVTCG